MAFTDAVERGHVEQAIVEFESLGRTRFLEKYGYGEAITYFVEKNGKLYDAKAIFGVAFKFSGHEQALSNTDFSGGEGWTNSRLRVLGFDVVDGKNWTDPELRSAMEAYLRLLADENSGRATNKAAMRRELIAGPLSRRNDGSIEMRMANLSAFFKSMGMPWVSGYKPRGHIGSKVRVRLEEILSNMPTELTDARHVRGLAVIHLKNPTLKTIPEGNPNPKIRIQKAVGFQRDSSVVAWVLKEANGRCERCNMDAPFVAKDGHPFLEVHHVVFLSQKGRDTIDNAAALCPNCHREAHFGPDPDEFCSALQSQISRLLP